MNNELTFEEWESTAESIFTCEYGSSSLPGIRDVYVLFNGIQLIVETILPRSIFKSQRIQCLVDYMVPDILGSIPNGMVDIDRYTPDGFGYPLFVGEDSVRLAWEYAMKINLKKV